MRASRRRKHPRTAVASCAAPAALALSLLSMAPLDSYAAPSPSLALSIAVSDCASASDGPQLIVSVTNTGRSAVEIPATWQPQDYWLNLGATSAAGSACRYIGPEYKVFDASRTVRLEVGRTVERRYPLQRWFSLACIRGGSITARWGRGPDGRPVWNLIATTKVCGDGR